MEVWKKANREPISVLIVDDSEPIRELLATYLREKGGFAITEAENGKDALEYLQSGRIPDFIVLDLEMPLLNGLEFYAKFKLMPTCNQIPLILYTEDAFIRNSMTQPLLIKHFCGKSPEKVYKKIMSILDVNS